MARFKFRLAQVARVKTIIEEQRKQEWALANMQLMQAKAHLMDLENQRQESLEFGYRELGLAYRPLLHQYLQHMDMKIEFQQEIVNEAAAHEHRAREIWIKARQEKEMLERLREKKYQAFVYEQARKEQNQLDDLKNNVPRI